MPESPSAESTAPHYDAFLSYSRADGAAVRRIQRFLESYRPPGRSARLKVYLDETDMRGGSLPDNLSVALGQSRALVVCWSDNAARSQWVNAEIAEFRKLGRPSDIAVMHVAGDGPTVRHEAFAGLAPIEHDLRRGWFGWFLRSKARIELLRLIAFLTGVEMRVLHNWTRRRLLRNVLIGAAAGVLPVVALLSIPTQHWSPLPLTYENRPIDAIACEVVDDRLWAAAWHKIVGESTGANAFFVTYADVIADPAAARDRTRTFPLAKRALPEPYVDPGVLKIVKKVFSNYGLGKRLEPGVRKDTIRIAQPRDGHFVVVLPIPLTASERAQAEEASRIDKLPPPETKGAWIVVYKTESEPKLEKSSMSPPLWDRFTDEKQETAPARAISVIWQSNDEIWIGVAGERGVEGGLWHSPDGGGNWNKIDGFTSVTSLDLIASAGGDETLLVAEERFEYLKDSGTAPSVVRVVERAADGTWPPRGAPPYGSNSKIEICGTLPDGALQVRVDGMIYREDTRSLFRSALGGSGR
jgi:hypothetical protein